MEHEDPKWNKIFSVKEEPVKQGATQGVVCQGGANQNFQKRSVTRQVDIMKVMQIG